MKQFYFGWKDGPQVLISCSPSKSGQVAYMCAFSPLRSWDIAPSNDNQIYTNDAS